MKDTEEHQSEIIIEEQNYFIKAYKDLKDSIFNVLFVLLDKNDDDEEQTSMYSLAFESGVDYLQMFAFPFDATIIAVWNGGETLNKVSQIFAQINISSYLPGVSFNAFLILLYSLILLIILVLIDIIYVSYSFSKKKFKFTWPLVILAQLVPLFVTILFLPITETLLSVVRCQSDPDKGYQVMISFPEVICWQGWHLFHSGITLLFSSLFVFISSIVSLALFEPRMTSKKLTARQNSRGQVIFIMNKIICQLIFSFNPFDSPWIYCLMLFSLSGWLYWTYNMSDPFYNKKVSKFFRILSSYYFWTNFMLLVSQILSFTNFNGALIIWISGLPFIGVIIAFEQKSNIDQLFTSNLKFKSGYQVEKHLRYVLQLIQHKQTDKNAYMLITGYIQKHKQICTDDDCPLKIIKKGKNSKKKMVNEEQLSLRLLKKLEIMYRQGIKKYPNCTQLRISFAFFNLEHLKHKNKAYEQFSFAQKTDPTFEQQFIIYRFKKIIRENLQSKKDDSSDLIELIRFDNHIVLCEQAMVLSAQLHKEFWIELKQEFPDLKKLNAIGYKITNTSNTVRENYEEITKINSSIPEVLYSYATYLILIIKDVKEGKQILEFSKKIFVSKSAGQEKPSKSSQSLDLVDNSISQEPVIIISAKTESVGKITSVNSTFTEITGYHKDELVDRKIDKILPEIFQEVHGQLIHNFLDKEQLSTRSKYLSKKNYGYLRQKSGFIIPVQYKVIFKSQVHKFYVSFKVLHHQMKNSCHFIVNSHGLITDSSTLGRQFFGIQRKNLIEADYQLDHIGLQNIQSLHLQIKNGKKRQKGGEINKNIIFSKGVQYTCQVHVEAIEIKIEASNQSVGDDEYEEMIKKQKKIVGYYLKIVNKNYERLENSSEINEDQITHKTHKYDAINNNIASSQEIQEQFLPKESQQQASSEEKQQKSQQEVINLYEQPDTVDILIANLANTKEKAEAFIPFQLNIKIKTMRLINNEIKMAYDKNNFNDNYQNQNFIEQDDEGDAVRLNDQNYHSKIRSAINTKLDHGEVTKLKIVSLLIVLIIIGINIITLIGFLSIYEGIKNQTQSYFLKIQQSFNLAQSLSAIIYQTDIQQTYQNALNHSIKYVSQEQVNIVMSNGDIQSKKITDAIRYLNSAIANYLILKNNTHLNSEDGEQLRRKALDHIFFNYIQRIYPFLRDSKLPKIQKFRLIEEYIKTASIYFTFIISPVIFLLIFWIYTRLKIDQKKLTILLWFLDIPIYYVAFLKDNCDVYLKNFMSVKEIKSKGLNQPPQIYEIQQENLNKENTNLEQQIQQQEKARRSLIFKQRKKGLCSYIKLSYIKMVWIILFQMAFWLVVNSYTGTYHNIISFLYQPLSKMGEQVTKSNFLMFSSAILLQDQFAGKSDNLLVYRNETIEYFKNYLTEQSIRQFNFATIGYQASPNILAILTAYTKVLFTDICVFLKTEDPRCQNLLGSSLKGSFRIYSMYISDESKLNSRAMVRDFRTTNQLFSTVALINVLQSWKNQIVSESNNGISALNITFYVCTFAGTIIFAIGWLIYLARINEEINEAIKMLNMIPFKLLSRSRKETREFIVWLIREANLKIHTE